MPVRGRICFRKLKKWKFLVLIFVLTILSFFFSSPNIMDKPKWSNHSSPNQDDWQEVTGLYVGLPYTYILAFQTPLKLRVYSAFAFQNSKFDSQLIVIGSHTYPMVHLQCRFHSNSEQPLITQATTNLIPDWLPRYSAVFITCPFPPHSGGRRKPHFVSITPPKSSRIPNNPSNHLRINYQPYQGSSSSNFRFNFSVCVLPTFGAFNQVFRFLEWLEYYKMMGAQHFTFYNMSIGPSISCIWNHLSTSGQISVHPWHNFPLIPNPEELAYSFGNSAAMTDCQFRYTGISKYVAVVDLDEFITPVLSNLTSFQDLISYLDSTRPQVEFGQYVFLNGFFLLESQHDPHVGKRCAPLLHQKGQVSSSSSLEYQVCQHLFMMKYIQREPISEFRTKYIMMPERVQVAGNHYVHVMEHPANYSTYNVTTTIAYHRHFRGALESSNSTSRERLDIKVGFKLATRVAKQVEFYKNKCGLRDEDIFIKY